MKKLLITGLLTVAVSAFAAMNDCLLSFSTKGPDTYADGSVVRDGECYALVWVAQGSEFKGFSGDGKLVDETVNRLLLVAPVAKGGRCPPVLFQISAETVASLQEGYYGVYLLDTRVAQANGDTTVAGSGKLNIVNGYGAVAKADKVGMVSDASVAEEDETRSSNEEGGVVAAAGSVAPADSTPVKIKAIQIVDDNVFLTVDNNNIGGIMRIQSGTDLKTFNITGAAQKTADGATEAILVTPKSGNSGFFKVIRN